ncbi:tRNA (mnm(5)s(2)U34)-methyltransferase [Planctomicrobium sp. SH668]|uniref:tRNA (mnm(5)s(2)U34)-methyltransferase n=1 Tax=Planctomicrobium sp. SH668 TaxID=3448126 RepID=UPI003F5C6EF2
MVPITQLAHDAVHNSLSAGGIAIDATAGNGHDTLRLAQRVTSAGHVWAIDLQAQAIEKTGQRLASNNITHATLVQGDHSQLKELVPSSLVGNTCAIMFNLGYLPGGDHLITTDAQKSVAALQASVEFLKPQGVLTVITYRGHEGGAEEADAVENWGKALPTSGYDVSFCPMEAPQLGPRLMVIVRIPNFQIHL